MSGRLSLPVPALLFLSLWFAAVPVKLAAQNVKTELSALPLTFERNQGQAPDRYRFLSRRNSMETFFLADGMDIVVSGRKSRASGVYIRWAGADPAASLTGEELLPGRSNYLQGSDPARWVRDVPQFGGLRYKHIYPGIDLFFHGYGNALEHDFLLEAGADPTLISFRFDKPVRLSPSGDLIADLGDVEVHFLRPVAYQESGKSRQEVAAEFLIANDGEVRFKLGAYDHTKALVIDPVFGFSTYLDGSNSDSITAVTTDSAGNVYVTGFTASTDFPITNAGAPLCQQCVPPSQSGEAFVSKLDPTGHVLLFSTFLGGSAPSSANSGHSIALDKNGNIYVAGLTSASDFPNVGAVVSPATIINQADFFVAAIKADGSSLIYSGRIGGVVGTFTNGNQGLIAIDTNGNAYLTGVTDDPHFQLTTGTIGSTPIGFPFDTAFVLKVDPTGKLVYSTLIPGNAPATPGAPEFNNNFPASGILVDANGQVTLAGVAGLGLPTTPGVVQQSFPNNANSGDPEAGYVLQLNAGASALNFATYLTGTDTAGGLAVDAQGNFYIAGNTSESNLPVSANAFQKSLIPGPDCTCNAGYILKLHSQAKTVLAATYLSGTPPISNAGTFLTGLALDSKSNVLVGGETGSVDFPLKNPLLATLQFSTTDVGLVVAQMSSDLSTELFGSFLSATDSLGGSEFTNLMVDAQDNVIIVGTTFANDFPTTPNSFQPTPPPSPNPLEGFMHTFIAKLNLNTPGASVCLASTSINFGAVLVGTSSTINLGITNCGNAALQFSSVVSSVPSITVGSGCISIAAGASCSLPLTFTPADNSQILGTITLTANAAITRQVVSVSGKGGTPQVFLPSSFQVDDLVLGTHVESFLGFINMGDGNWVVSNVTATGDFTVDNRCTAPLPPSTTIGVNNTCSIGIIFTPSQSGLRTGTLTIADNQAGSPHVVALSGNSLTSYPTPSISSILAVAMDAQQPALQVTGTFFFPGSQVFVNGASLSTVYEGETNLAATLTAADLAQSGELSITVSNPAPGGGVSNSFPAAIYAAIRNISFRHSVYDPKSGHIFSSVDPASMNFAGQVLVIDPATANILSKLTVGNGPNQLAISDDGQFLYVGLDGDKKVAQVALPAGTVNFAVGLGNDPSFGQPMVADAIRVLPGHPHSWAVTLCGVGFEPCGEGVAVFDDSVERSTLVFQNQLQPDALVFVGHDATTLYGTTLFQIPSTFYKFAITSSGISLSQSVTNFSGPSPGGGTLDSDGTSIYVNNGQIIDPATLALKNFAFPIFQVTDAFAVDVPSSRIYFGANASGFLVPDASSEIATFDLLSTAETGSLGFSEFINGTEMYRWGTNGLAISSPSAMFLIRTSLTSASVPAAQFFVSSLSPNIDQAGSPDLTIMINGGGFAAGDSVTANGIPVQIVGVSPAQITATIPAALLSVAGDIQITVTDTSDHVAFLVLTVSGEPTNVALSTNVLNFAAQVVGSSSMSQTVTFSNSGTTPLIVSGVTSTGDFSQTNNCATVAPGSNCSISVVFKPSATGNRSGLLQISDNDFTKMQTVALSGVGSDVQIGGSGSSGTTATVASGKSASYSLTITPQGGFTGQLSFSCTNLPQFASCSFNPSSATIGTSPVNVTVTIATSQQQSASLARPSFPTITAFAYLTPVFLLLFGVRRRGAKRSLINGAIQLLIVALVFFPLAGCGGGASSTPSPAPPAPSVTPAGTYSVNFVVSNAQLSRSITLTLTVN